MAAVLGDVAVPALLVEAATACIEIERVFARESELSSVVVMDERDAAHLVPRRRFMMEMAGPIGYGRALHANRTILEMAQGFRTLRLSASLDLGEAGQRALERDSRWRYDDVLVEGEDGCLCTATVAELFSQLSEQHERRSLSDPMTGLANRAGFSRSVAVALLDRQSPECVAAVLFVDVDDFKAINDTFGHAVGDIVLTELGGRLRAAFRETDVVARLGGDEFAILLPDTSGEAAAAAAERVVSLFAQPITAAGQTFSMSASVGFALQDSSEQPVDVLLRNADLAMYDAKRQGKACTASYRRQLHNRAVARFDMLTELATVLDRDELQLHYQPIVDLSNGSTLGVEALLRWVHPTRGVIAPLDFLPLAEETGLIVPLGRWVLGEACRQAAAWQASVPTLRDICLSVNASVRQLEDGFDAIVADALAESGLSPQSLTIEITETAPTARDARAVVDTLYELRRADVRIAIDDFGVGYSSFARLEDLPIHEIKIDQSFTARIDADAANGVLQGLLGLTQAMDLDATVEGVETQEQVDVLTALGYRRAQGFLFSRPAPAAELFGGPAAILGTVRA